MLPTDSVIHNRYRLIYTVDERPGYTLSRVRDEQTNRLMLMAALAPAPDEREDLQLLVRQVATVRQEMILAVLDHFAEGDRYYVVCEDVSGQDLERTLRARGEPFAEADTLVQARKLLDALEQLHSQKPALFVGDPLATDVLIDDRGAWHLVPFTLIRPIAHAPSPYRAPELDLPDAEPAPAGDLYSLTALLYHALTGWAPPTTAQRQAGAPLNGPRSLNSRISTLTEQVLLRGLQLKPENRYQLPREMRMSIDMVQMMGGRSLGIGPDIAPAAAAAPPPLLVPPTPSERPPAPPQPAYPPPITGATTPLAEPPYPTGIGAAPAPRRSMRTGCLVAVALALALAAIAVCAALAWFVPGSPLPRLFGQAPAPAGAAPAPAIAATPEVPAAATAAAPQPTLAPASLGPRAITLQNAAQITSTSSFTNPEIGPVAFSPDGTTLAVGVSSVIQLRNAATLEPFSPPRQLQGHTGRLFTLAYSPDGTLLASGAIDENAVRIWSTADGRQVRTLADHRGWVRAVAFSPDGTLLASGSFDHTVKLWNVDTGALLHTLSGHSDFISTVAFSPDSARLATSSADGKVLLWDVASGSQLSSFAFEPAPNLATGAPLWATGLAFSGDGKILAIGSEDGSIVLVDAATGKGARALMGHTGIVVSRGLLFAPDGKTLASASFDGSIRLWDTTSATETAELREHGLRVLALAFSPDGTHLASTSDQGGQLVLWDVAGRSAERSLQIGQGLITALQFSPDGTTLGVVGYNGISRLHLLEQQRYRVLPGSPAAVNSLAFLSDSRLASISDEGTVTLLDLKSGSSQALPGLAGRALNIAASADGRVLVAGSSSGAIGRWDGASARPQPELRSGLGAIYALALSPDGALLAAGGPPDDPRVEIWDVAAGKLLQTLSGSDTAIASMAFQPRGGRLAIATLDGKLTLWDARAGTLGTTIQAPRQGGRFSALAFSPDGTLLMTGSPASDVAFWDAQSGAAAGALPAFDLNRNGVYAAAFSPDGQRLAVGLGDQSVQIFELGAGR